MLCCCFSVVDAVLFHLVFVFLYSLVLFRKVVPAALQKDVEIRFHKSNLTLEGIQSWINLPQKIFNDTGSYFMLEQVTRTMTSFDFNFYYVHLSTSETH